MADTSGDLCPRFWVRFRFNDVSHELGMLKKLRGGEGLEEVEGAKEKDDG